MKHRLKKKNVFTVIFVFPWTQFWIFRLKSLYGTRLLALWCMYVKPWYAGKMWLQDYKKKRNHYEVFCLFHEYLERFFSFPNTGIKCKDAVLKITWTPLWWWSAISKHIVSLSCRQHNLIDYITVDGFDMDSSRSH